MVLSNSADQTRKIAKDFAKTLKGSEILLLFGDLGSGKTTFVQGLAKGLGIKKRIISPTFVLIRQYPIPPLLNLPQPSKPSKPSFLYHVDLYRIGAHKEAWDLGLSEIFADKDAIVSIEWADRLGKNFPKGAVKIYFETVSSNQRRIKMENVK